jgi:eukaryotic-like serine/threonine-protein kinase
MSSGELAKRRLGRYELIAEIASGGMGIVCLARAVGVGGFRRLFAIKVMHPHLVKDPQFIAMLLDEAQLAARIHHPNVVATVDICTVDDCYFVVMDYVDGFQLLDVMEHDGITREQRIRSTNRILLDAMAGLEAAHTLQSDDGDPIGLVHRDVSPQNIMIGIDGIARLTDFGIALAASRISASRPGTIKGKPSYMAPEQARAHQVDRRADVWALGVILWEGLTGQRLFVGDTEAATVLKVIDMTIQSPRTVDPGVPEALAAVCLKALERDPAKRFASARQMAGELERAAAAGGLLADSHEVADLLRNLFAREIERRKAAIRSFANAIGPASAPMGPRDVYELPRLDEVVKGDTLLSPVPHTPELRGTPSAAVMPARTAVSGSAPIVDDKPTVRSGPPRASRDIGPDPTLMEATAEVPRSSSTKKLGAILLVAALLGAAAVLFFTRKPEPGAAASVASAEARGADSAPPVEPSVAPTAPPSATALEITPTVTPSAAPPPTVAQPAPRHAGPRRPPPPSGGKQEPPKKSGPSGPVIEENPYGLR